MRLIDADKLKKHYAWWNNVAQRDFDAIVDAQPTVGGEFIPRDWLLKNTNTGMNVIEILQTILDAPVAKPMVEHWISSEDRVPETEEYVLCCTRTKAGQKSVVRGYYADGRWCCGMNSNVTHWMPLPEVPE